MPRENPRNLRVAAELKRIVNELLCHEVGDPRLSGVRISGVDVSNDLGVARLYFNTLDPDGDPEAVDAALRRASGFLRSRVGHEIRLRRVPELRFAQDVGSKRGLELTQLIDEATSRDRGRASSADDDGD